MVQPEIPWRVRIQQAIISDAVREQPRDSADLAEKMPKSPLTGRPSRTGDDGEEAPATDPGWNVDYHSIAKMKEAEVPHGLLSTPCGGVDEVVVEEDFATGPGRTAAKDRPTQRPQKW